MRSSHASPLCSEGPSAASARMRARLAVRARSSARVRADQPAGVVTERLESLRGAGCVTVGLDEDRRARAPGGVGPAALALDTLGQIDCGVFSAISARSRRTVLCVDADDLADAPQRPSLCPQPRHDLGPLLTGEVPPEQVGGDDEGDPLVVVRESATTCFG